MSNRKIEHENYVIRKTSRKHPKEYPNAKNHPHVQVNISCDV